MQDMSEKSSLDRTKRIKIALPWPLFETLCPREKRCRPRDTYRGGVVRPPRLQRAAGYVTHHGRLPLGDTLGVQIALPFKEGSAFEASPAVVIIITTLLLWDYCCHRDCLFQPFALTS
jgi:hypothetical protein